MKKMKAPEISFIRGSSVRPNADHLPIRQYCAEETTDEEFSYYANQKDFSSLTVRDLPLANLSPDDKITISEVVYGESQN